MARNTLISGDVSCFLFRIWGFSKTKQTIQLDGLTPKLIEADVIYLGEEHYTPSHIEAALKILRMLCVAIT